MYDFRVPSNYEGDQLARARTARKNPSVAEQVMWQILRGNRLGFKFRREHPIDRFRLDFYCPEARLAIEMDGEQHEADRDAERDKTLEKYCIEVMRIPNREFFEIDEPATKDLIRDIVARCESRTGRRADDSNPRNG